MLLSSSDTDPGVEMSEPEEHIANPDNVCTSSSYTDSVSSKSKAVKMASKVRY